MLFHKLCHEYIQLHKGLFWSFIIISSISYIVKILVTPMIYSNIMDLTSTNFTSIIKQLCILWTVVGVIYIVKLRLENKLFPEFLSFVRQRLLRLYLEKNKTDFNEASVSADITRIFEVTRYMKDIFAWTAQFILPMCILIVVINSYFMYKLPVLGIINIGCNISIIGYIYKNYSSLVENSNRREAIYMNMVKKLDENFNNLMNIYLNNQKNIMGENETIDNVSIFKELKSYAPIIFNESLDPEFLEKFLTKLVLNVRNLIESKGPEFPCEKVAWKKTFLEAVGHYTATGETLACDLLQSDADVPFIHYNRGIPPVFNKLFFKFEKPSLYYDGPFENLLQQNISETTNFVHQVIKSYIKRTRY